MNVNGIGAAGYPAAGYMTRKAERNAESAEKGFLETVAEKAAEDKKADYDEKAFESVGANAPEEVKQAWMEAAKEVSANGLGMKKNGMLSHISQMMVQADGLPPGEGHGSCEGGCGAERLYGEPVPRPAEKRGSQSSAGQGGSDGEGQPEDGGHENNQGG